MSEFKINPAFHRYPAEAAVIGRLAVAFGELEYSTVLAAARAVDNQQAILRALYRVRTTSARIDAADALMRPACIAANLAAEYGIMLAAVRHCLTIRNRYAHCMWGDHATAPGSGLFFTDLQESAVADEGFEQRWFHLDVAVLDEQEAYFVYAHDWCYFVDHELAVRVGKLRSHPWPKPTVREPPPAHNPPGQHTPLWLTEDQKALHLARAQAAQEGVPTPTPAQQALDKARAEKKAQKQADRDATAARLRRERPDPPE